MTTNLPEGWVDLDPEPVPENDPRVREASLVADGAWLRSSAATTAGRVQDVVRAVLAYVDNQTKKD